MQVAPIVAEAMHNYLLCESMLQVKVVPLEKIKPKMWVGANKRFKRNNWQKLERDRQNRVSDYDMRSYLSSELDVETVIYLGVYSSSVMEID